MGQAIDLVVFAHDEVVGDLVHQRVRFLEQPPDVLDLEGLGYVAQLLFETFMRDWHFPTNLCDPDLRRDAADKGF